MIQEILANAQKLYLNRGSIEREGGAHASGGGWCLKKAVLETLYPQFQKPFNDDTKMVFDIGNKIHDHFDEMLRLYARENPTVIWIQPWRLFTMAKIMRDAFEAAAGHSTSPIPLGVFGTPDGVLIDTAEGTVIVPDFKSSNERAFKFKTSGSRSFTHEVQVGSYLPGIMGMFNKIGCTNLKISEAAIVYINKSDYKICVHSYDPELAIQSASEYWKEFGNELGKFVKSGGTMLPEGNPPEKWMCDYCSMFDSKTECNSCLDISQLEAKHTTTGRLL